MALPVNDNKRTRMPVAKARVINKLLNPGFLMTLIYWWDEGSGAYVTDIIKNDWIVNSAGWIESGGEEGPKSGKKGTKAGRVAIKGCPING
jgi:hypothetical protein